MTKTAEARQYSAPAFKRGPGNPNLGRETQAQKELRTKKFREQNLLMKEEKLHVSDSLLHEFGLMEARHDPDIANKNSGTLDRFMDNLFTNSYWR